MIDKVLLKVCEHFKGTFQNTPLFFILYLSLMIDRLVFKTLAKISLSRGLASGWTLLLYKIIDARPFGWNKGYPRQNTDRQPLVRVK